MTETRIGITNVVEQCKVKTFYPILNYKKEMLPRLKTGRGQHNLSHNNNLKSDVMLFSPSTNTFQ
ncbi:hypothetical protein SDC9_62429 [bioreactor metagenome]|uniref:Uncharacterized protein n=1 Tax=bioreactor metagenome TaxID=1076179 RepID=A0A644XIP1_9ZZZZ